MPNKDYPKLRNCPFCGGEATLWNEYPAYRPWHILCGCGGRVGYFRTKEEAVAAWNRRVGDDLTERMEDDGK